MQEVRDAVFVQEHGVPAEQEHDAWDAAARYALARDPGGRAIGCGRLAADQTIGRLAVVPDWRGRGVGSALLHMLLDQARMRGYDQVSLAALATATGFYARSGFSAVGDVFIEAGLAHQTMRLALQPHGPPAPVPRDRGELPATGRELLHAARVQLLTGTQRRLAIEIPRLDGNLFASQEEWTELRRIATSGRGAEIRILLHAPAEALRNGHRLIALIQRLPSVVRVRVPVDETDLASTSSCLLNDSGGYLYLPDAERQKGRAALSDRAGQAPLAQHFNEVWERAIHASVLQPLDL